MQASIAKKKYRFYGQRFNQDVAGERQGLGAAEWGEPPFGTGDAYYGVWSENQPHESGCFSWYDGDCYVGDWQKGKFHGLGEYRFGKNNGAFAGDMYAGRYFQNKRNAVGVYHFAEKPELGVQSAVYYGEWRLGTIGGLGTLMHADGECYSGQWLSDQRDGHGIYTWGDNSPYAGDKYSGLFYNDDIHGYGKTSFADGSQHSGQWSQGKMAGCGVLTLPKGTTYYGVWDDDQMHGVFVRFNANSGTKQVVEFEEGEKGEAREFVPLEDYEVYELPARQAALRATDAAMTAEHQLNKVEEAVTRARKVRADATAAAERAKVVANAAMRLRNTMTAWFGLKNLIVPTPGL